MTEESRITTEIDWPQFIVDIEIRPGVSMELEYDLDDILTVEGDVTVVEIVDSGVVLEDAEGETHHIDMRDLSPERREFSDE